MTLLINFDRLIRFDDSCGLSCATIRTTPVVIKGHQLLCLELRRVVSNRAKKHNMAATKPEVFVSYVQFFILPNNSIILNKTIVTDLKSTQL